MSTRIFFLWLFAFAITTLLKAQTSVPTEKEVNNLNKHYTSIANKFEKQTTRYIKKLHKEELRLLKKLHIKDSVEINQKKEQINLFYAQLNNRLKESKTKLKPTNEYLPQLDSVYTSTQFLLQNNTKTPALKELNQTLNLTQSKLQASADIKRMMQKRKDDLRKQFNEKLEVKKQLDNISKETYYYKQQLTEYKNLLKDKQKLQQKVIGAAKNNPVFKDFMKRNGLLAKMFPQLNSNANAEDMFKGIDTKEQIMQELKQKFGLGTLDNISSNNNPIQQQINKAKKELKKVKDQVEKNKKNEIADADMPNFKPNSQKTKNFFQRLEYSTNWQTLGSNNFLPTITDIGLNIGYKLTEKSVMGIGATYKLGLGNGWNNIKLSTQGYGLRSFVDIRLGNKQAKTGWGKICKDFWLSGGLETNYLSQINENTNGNNTYAGLNTSPWQQAAMLGISKKITKGSKKVQVQLLHNLLYNKSQPQQTPLVFRVGWGL